jgi:hypothetical protein
MTTLVRKVTKLVRVEIILVRKTITLVRKILFPTGKVTKRDKTLYYLLHKTQCATLFCIGLIYTRLAVQGYSQLERQKKRGLNF